MYSYSLSGVSLFPVKHILLLLLLETPPAVPALRRANQAVIGSGRLHCQQTPVGMGGGIAAAPEFAIINIRYVTHFCAQVFAF